MVIPGRIETRCDADTHSLTNTPYGARTLKIQILSVSLDGDYLSASRLWSRFQEDMDIMNGHYQLILFVQLERTENLVLDNNFVAYYALG